MTSTSDGDLKPALEALRLSQWDQFTRHIRQMADLSDREKFWRNLAAAHGHGVDLFERLLSWPASDARQALRYLAPALGHVRGLTSEQVVRFLEYAACAGNEAGYRAPEVAKLLFQADLALATEVGDAIRAATGDPSELLWRLWASAFVQANAEGAAAYVTSLPRSTPEERLLVAHVLERLPTREPTVAAALRTQEQQLADAMLQEAPRAGVEFSVQWSALCRLAEFSKHAMSEVMAAARAGETPALIALANWLMGHASLTVGATGVPLADVLDLLLAQAAESEDLRNRAVDGCVASLLYNHGVRSTAIACVERLGKFDGPVATEFDETFAALVDVPGKMDRVLTAWLVSGESTFSAITSLLGSYRGRGLMPGLDAATFMAVPSDRKVAAVRRILALTMDGPTLCAFIAVFAESPAFQPEGLAWAEQLLQEVFAEYPGATEEFINERVASMPAGAPYASVYQQLHQHAQRWHDVLQKLPRRKELRPTDFERLALAAMHRRFARDVHRGAEKASIFGMLATKVNLAQGRRFTSLFGPGSMNVTPTSLISHEVELPTSEVSDPLGAMIRRNKILLSAR